MSSIVLQKKLEELERELDDLFRVPLKDPPFEISFDDIFKRFEFLENLHALESNSSQPDNADHMLEMGRKINALKTSFARWDESRKKFHASNGDEDSQSICSDCTQTLLYELEECNNDDVNYPPRSITSEKKKKAAGAGPIKGRMVMGRYLGAFGCGFIVGAVFVLKLFLHYNDDGGDHLFFPVPRPT